MSETEETLIEDVPVEAPQSDVTNEDIVAAADNTNNPDEETPTEGERPEWLKDKYSSVDDQAKAYAELEKKFGGFTGAPEEYELSLPEGIEGEFDMEDARMQWFQKTAKESNMSQDTFTQMLHGWVEQEAEATSFDREGEMKALGNNAQGRLRDLADWGNANLDPEQYEGFKILASSAMGVEVLEALVGKTREGAIPRSTDTVQSGETPETLQRLIASPEYQTSPEFRKDVERKFKEYYG